MDAASSERYLKELLKSVSHDELAGRLRARRISAGLSIRELADRAMLSKTSIVAMEQGKGCRPITLEKVCRALNLHVERLALPDGEQVVVQRSKDASWYGLDSLVAGPVGAGNLTDEKRQELLASGLVNPMAMFKNVPSDAGFIAGIVEITHATESRSHPGAEFGYVIEGLVGIDIDGEMHEAGVGEAFFVPDGAVHSYANRTRSAKVLLFRLT